MVADDFLRRFARTGQFRYGEPREFTVSPDGRRVVYLRSADGTDPVTRLWVLDIGSGRERLVADPDVLLGGRAEELPAQERARRERSRQRGGGIVGYSADRAVRRAAFALSGRLWLADLISGTVAEISVPEAVIDPRIDPTGRRIGYVREGALRIVGCDGDGGDHDGDGDRDGDGDGGDSGDDRELAGPEGPEITYGLAEHVAAEEMGRSRGFWWSPDGERLLVARADTALVQRWYIADPAQPSGRRDRSRTRLRERPTPTSRSGWSVSMVSARRSGGTGRRSSTWWPCPGTARIRAR